MLRRVGVGDSGSAGVELRPRPRRLCPGDPGGLEVLEPALDWEVRPPLRTPLLCNELRSSSELVPLVARGGGVDWRHFLLEGGGVRAGGERVSGPLFIALEGSGLVTNRLQLTVLQQLFTSAG